MAEEIRSFDLPLTEIDDRCNGARRGMENSLPPGPLGIGENYKKQLKILPAACGEARPVLHARNKYQALLAPAIEAPWVRACWQMGGREVIQRSIRAFSVRALRFIDQALCLVWHAAPDGVLPAKQGSCEARSARRRADQGHY